MIEVRTKYQSSVFGRFAAIEASSETVKTLLELFQDLNLLPGTFHEFSPGESRPRLRLQLVSPDERWYVRFATHRIDVEERTSGVEPDSSEKLGTFTHQSAEIFGRLLDAFGMKGTRLSLVTGGLLGEMSQAELDRAYELFMKPTPFYHENRPFEWNSRHVARLNWEIGGNTEDVNLITSVDRVQGFFEAEGRRVSFDRIGVGFDINTAPQNDEPRFRAGELPDFYALCIDVREKILREIGERLNG